MFRWILGGAVSLATIIAVTLAVWPSSAVDTAHDDGERLGTAIIELRDAESSYAVDDALTEVREAADTARDHAGEELDAQITEQADNLSHALNGFAGYHQSDNEWDQDVYDYEYTQAVDELQADAVQFRDNAPEVGAAFVDGLRTGLGVES